MDTVTTTTKSPWLSTINWSQLVGAAMSMLAALGLSTTLTPEQITGVVVSIQSVVAFFTVIKNTWFSPTVLTPSATELSKGAVVSRPRTP